MTASDTYLLLRAFVDELARCGLRHACTSPGSRCTPIVLTLVRDGRIRCWSHVDERCAGFFALGAAKASGQPVAVTCTSGTAAANLAPAVIEAHEARVPLLVLTADRPPELREVGAGQTIDQLKLYGGAVRWFFEVDVHDATPERIRWIRALACRAFHVAVQGSAGPVHLNFPLREPLVLDGQLGTEPGGGGRAAGAPWVSFESEQRDRAAFLSVEASRPVFVAGAYGGGAQVGAEVAALAARVNAPLLADPLSGARRGPAAVAHYDLLLRDHDVASELAPSAVYRIGDLPTSKPLRRWLAGLDVPQVQFSRDGVWGDPDARLSVQITTAPSTWADLGAAELGADSPRWLDRWLTADAVVADTITAVLGSELSEPAVAAALGGWLPSDATLFVASSMPIRDLETYLPARSDPPRILSNRGANGIDGTVSSAFGAAAVAAGRVVLLIGDVALAHDLGGLLAARRTDISITIVVVNNDGGGIFNFLPVAGERDAFEDHIATPHGLDFARAAALFECAYERIESLKTLRGALDRALGNDTTTLLEVRTERGSNRTLHEQMELAVARALQDQWLRTVSGA
jgi:2-succinyl-5-enolpyruvyl-6-hydroxy-3-cyclohexene-1-carboxylate synthase